MKLTEEITNKIYKAILIGAFSILVLIALLVMVSPFYNREDGGISLLISNLFYAALIPGLFFLGYYINKYKVFKLENILLVIGASIAIIVIVSMVATLISYGFFHSTIYKNTPIYYLDGDRYDVTQEVYLFTFSGLVEVDVDYASTYGLLAGAFLPATFFINKKNNLNKWIISLLIGSIGAAFLLIIPSFKGLIVLALISAFAIIYKFYWNNKKAINIIRYSLLGLLGLAMLFYAVIGINASLGFVFKGFLDKLFVSNTYMSKVSTVLEGMNMHDGANYINLFGLNFNYVITSQIEEIAKTQTGIFEVELLKEIGPIGVALTLAFVVLSFYSFDKELSNDKKNDFEKVSLVMILGSFFVYCSLFYDAIPYVFKVDGVETYVPFLRFLPFLMVMFLLGMSYFVPNKAKKEEK